MNEHRDPCCAPSGAIDRRGFVRLSVGGYLGLLLGGRAAWADEPRPAIQAAESLIVLWLNGGPSHLDTWDPKPGTPEGGPTKAIKTSAKGVEIAEYFPRMAEQMHRVSLVRGMSTKEGNHQRARYYLHTGYVPSGTVAHPDLGALVCQQRAGSDLELPPYVAISGATPGPGALGVGLAPFTVQDPTKPVANLAYPSGVDAARFARRRDLLSQLTRGFVSAHPGPETDGHEAVYARADRLIHSPRAKAFDVASEPQAVREAYGTSKFGTGCLMARRLIEEGVRVVEVQLNGWDTHKDNFNRLKKLGGELDQGFAALLADLAERGRLEKTVVLCMGEFGRTPRINADEGRDHFAKAWSLAIAGGPIRGGQVVGATSSDGTKVLERPVGVPELVATVCQAMGLDRQRVNNTPQGRPISVVDQDAPPIGELFG